MLTQYQRAIKQIENKNKQDIAVFPNFFHGMSYKHIADSLEEFIQSTLNRMKLLHLHDGKLVSEDFFKHVISEGDDNDHDAFSLAKLLGQTEIVNLMSNYFSKNTQVSQKNV